MRNKGTAVSLH